MPHEIESLRRAIALGEEVIRISDAAGQSLASVHIHMGVEMIRAHVERAEAAALSSSAGKP
ncbi:hypothetical protein P1X14_14795 [Sphingomonas sp. AOB5]|uniref:hypothetical protein n=1 Tax=Sphingomonas sp. AOB5 TaxID=3034017 RepID=UPI0023FA4B36|nr:hypothetical protein [Sphingomonas sp. AOB5]MDF7776521.1 hypothetical protein [Sphingomonas sp. AOB5]